MKISRLTKTACFAMVLVSVPAVAAEDITEADYRPFRDYLVGDWKVESQGFSGTITFKMSPTKRCLTSLGSIDGGPTFHGIEGYDAEKKSWMRILFWGHGGHAIAHTQIDKSSAGGSLDGLTLKGDVHDVNSGGDATDSKVVYKVVDRNKWEVHREEAIIVYTRQRKNRSSN